VVSFSLVYDILRWEEKEILNEAKKREINLNTLEIKNVNFKLDKNVEKSLKEEIFLQRCTSSTRRLFSTAILEYAGGQVINNFQTNLISSNKLLTNIILLKNRIPAPLSYVSFSEDSCIKSSEILGFPLVFKPIVGSWGRFVHKIRDQYELKNILEYRSFLNSMYKEVFYIQEYVEKPCRDIRCIVVGDEIVATIYRYQANDDFRTNVALGGKVEEARLSDVQKEIFFKVKEAIGGEILGIDAMEKKDQILINEINSSVEFGGAAKVAGKKIVESILNYIVKKGKR